MDSYLEIKEFSKCSKQDWNTFCENSDDVWLWHHYDSIVAKSLWTNLENNSFAIIDNSNKKQFVSILPFFLEKKKKIIDYSSFESTGGPAFINDISEKKKQKIIRFMNSFLINEMKRRKIYKSEFLLSTLSSSIINTKRSIPNPLFPLIDRDNSSFTWILNLKEKSAHEIGNRFSKKTKDILNKNKDELMFIQAKKKDLAKVLDKFYNYHISMTSKKNINSHSYEYFKYIFLNFPEKNKKIFYVVNSNKNILTISIFGTYKKKVIYWCNTSNQKGLDVSSNYFCMSKSIEYFKKEGFSFFEFGEGFNSLNPSPSIGLNHFKKSFGGEKFPLFRGEKIVAPYKNLFFNILRLIFLKFK